MKGILKCAYYTTHLIKGMEGVCRSSGRPSSGDTSAAPSVQRRFRRTEALPAWRGLPGGGGAAGKLPRATQAAHSLLGASLLSAVMDVGSAGLQ